MAFQYLTSQSKGHETIADFGLAIADWAATNNHPSKLQPPNKHRKIVQKIAQTPEFSSF